MELNFIVPILALITMFAIIVFALKSKHEVEKKRDNPDASKSTLAPEAPSK